MESSNATALIMERLRSSTSELHNALEEKPFQQTLAKGTISREAYTDYLTQMLHIHRCVESLLMESCHADARVAAIVKKHHYKVDRISDDLRCLDVDPDGLISLPGTAYLCQAISLLVEDRFPAVLGFHYVLEGSTNGGKYLAKALAKGLNLTCESGLSYFDPYGDRQREFWGQFKADMNAVSWQREEEDNIVAGALKMFERLGAVCNELQERWNSGNTNTVAEMVHTPSLRSGL